MASIRREISIAADAETVWAAIRDVGAVHRRLVPGIVTDVRMEDDARVVTFSDGFVVRELIVDIDDTECRVAYAAVGGRAKHHNASMQVSPDGPHRSRLVWITDILPHEAAPLIAPRVEQGLKIMKQTLERSNAAA
ncbi:MAG TPA: SRPBCC family protein [Candidatus Cybelea sp.]|nr:SRPBCC family protein [Candidatus Cybelea sp.]